MDQRSSTAPERPHGVTRRYVEAAGRAIHYRVAGTGPAIVMLHDSPRSARLHLPTMHVLADRFRVYAIDTPGYGNSQPLDCADPTITDFAAILGATIRAIGLEGAPIYATHTSAKIALEYAANRTSTAGTVQLILDGLSIPAGPANEAFIAAYMRPFVIEASGGYLAAEWTRMRDMLRWFPWFDPSPHTRMPGSQPTDAWISDYMIDLLSAGASYSSAYAAAMRYDPVPALLRATTPVLIAARADDVLYGSLDRVPIMDNQALTIQRLPADTAQWLVWLENTLAAAVTATDPTPPLPKQPVTGPIYVDLPYGPMRVHRSTPSGKRRLLILSAPTTLQGLAWQMALPDRSVLVPELPGFGESDPLPSPSLQDTADALAGMLDQLGCTCVDVLAIGFATPLACTLAERHPAAIGRIVLDGCYGGSTETALLEEHVAPVFPFDIGGGHIHRYWHMLRDGEANWPYHAGAVSAARGLVPMLAAGPLHDALVGILKQPEHYGEIARAGARLDDEARYSTFLQDALILHRSDEPGYGGTDALAARLPRATVIERPADLAAAAKLANHFLTEGARAGEVVR